VSEDEELSRVEKIQAAEASVATLQDQLDMVQRTLQTAEELAAAGEAAKEKAQQLMAVSVAVLVVTLVVLVFSRKKAQRS
jgi:hypothetical protein